MSRVDTRKQNKNKGFSMVEIMVVIAILAVVGGISFSLTNILPHRQVSSCAENLITQVEKTRTDAMSYQGAYILIMAKDDGIYVQEVVQSNGAWEQEPITKIGEEGIKLEYIEGSNPYTELPVGDGLMLSFDRSTGGIDKCYVTVQGQAAPTPCGVFSNIRLSSPDGYNIELALSKFTGKISYAD